MKTKREPNRCPTCGHIVDDRVLHLNKTLVAALYRVWRWCEEKDRFVFQRKEVRHLFTSETMVACFGDLIYFGGILFRPEFDKRRGSWALNQERARLFFANKRQMFSKITIDRVKNEIREREEPLYMKEIPNLNEFLDEEYKFVPEYAPREV